MAKSVKVLLGGKEFEVMELPSRANVAWRKKLQMAVTELVDKGMHLSGSDLGGENANATLSAVVDLIAEAPEIATGLMRQYAPGVDACWVELEEQLYESELIDAFEQILKLAFPFGKLVGLFRTLQSGVIPRRTQPSSH